MGMIAAAAAGCDTAAADLPATPKFAPSSDNPMLPLESAVATTTAAAAAAPAAATAPPFAAPPQPPPWSHAASEGRTG
ncbi:hypothetical protein CHLRE_05g238761v5 [Chlamydomonas reinhardtii]|uniref:Uncharacterized protein n=1 Tax=Chlamydomonas reinhardtii TaxID=3055 RepID=A0A2K3DT19_CHLRE|nr:uncharacterized protein CHLRE_05g238761v5 [Chlamydomonas reinhardtii]PNW83673.1 hypothetical protein CHLRE_05g238761v5 [Chlamydomonas reinhardtii]